jgi:hypothetical protein
MLVLGLVVGVILFVLSILALAKPQFADWFYDLTNRKVAEGLKVSERTYERNRANSRRAIPLGTLVIAVGIIVGTIANLRWCSVREMVCEMSEAGR